MVESGCKHGPFDLRSPGRRKIATPSWELQLDRDGPGTLDWSSFLARFFPTRQRHDSEALAAYAAYRNARPRGVRALSGAAAVTCQKHTARSACPGNDGRRGQCEERRRAGTCELGVGGRQRRPRSRRSRVIVAASTVAVWSAIAAAAIVVALVLWYVLPRGGKRKRRPRT
jgi:hypothetical protein